jgi:hypothetical protein
MIHGLDISVGLGLPRRVPVERVAIILRGLQARNVNYFGTDLSGVRLEAVDLDWGYGDGQPVRGAAQDLLLVLSGRRLSDDLLEGVAARRFTD